MTPGDAARRAAASLITARDTLAGSDAVDEADTALIGVDLEALDARLDALIGAFPASVRHAVAIKTMPHPAMLRHLVLRGFGLEAASLEEVQLAIGSGADPSDVIFDSPVKTRAEIAWCQEHLPGGLLNANSIEELDRYPDSPSFQVGLRINPEVDTGAPTQFDVSARRSKFGVPISTDIDVLADACATAGVTALHMHIGSQVAGCDAHIQAVGRLLQVASDIDDASAERGDERRITTIDIGGGLRSEAEPTVMNVYGGRLQRELPGLFAHDVRTEFGQWVHATAGWAASRVESVEARAVPTAFLHLGADFFMRDVYATEPNRTGSFDYEIAVVRDDGTVSVAADADIGRHSYDLVGPLCFAGDVLAVDVALPELREGDWLVFAGTGANTFGLWSRHCSRAVPKVLATTADRSTVWSPRAG